MNRLSPRVTAASPSNTCQTAEPTIRRGAVRTPARSRWNSVRMVTRASPPVVGLL
ncbi:hypothetical protein ACFQX6_33215 [Streptosporangium lutulentum]